MISGSKRIDILTIALYVFSFFIILSGSSMYSSMEIAGITSNSFFLKCAVCVAAGIIFLIYFLPYKASVSYYSIWILFLLGIHSVIYILVTRHSISRFITSFILPLVVFAVLCMMLRNVPDGYDKLMKTYCTIVLAIAAVSLFCYLFGTILRILPGSIIIKYTKKNEWYSCRSYFYLYFEAQTQRIMGIRFIRNCGIFMEAPGFALPLTFAFLYELFQREKNRKWACVILFVAGLTSWSMKAIVTMSLILLLHVILSDKFQGKYKEIIRYLAGPIVMVAAGIVIAATFYIKVNENIHSLMTRMDDLQASLHAWTDHVLFGYGYENYDAIRQYFTFVTNDYTGITAGMAIVLAQGGLWMMGLYLFSIFSWYRNAGKKNRKAVFVFLLIFLLYWFNTSMQYRAIMFLIMAMGLIPPILTAEFRKNNFQEIGSN